MSVNFRCNCPTTSALDIIGDKWSLVIIKQMLFEGKSIFKDFTESNEAIATNILSSRLKQLEEYNIVEKHAHPTNKKTKVYILTEKGIALAPTLLALTVWSYDHLKEFHPNLVKDERIDIIKNDPKAAAEYVKNVYRKGIKEQLQN